LWGDVVSVETTDGWLDRAEEDAGDDPWLRSQIHRMRCFLAWQRLRYRELPQHARLALEMAERAGDPVGIAASLALVVAAEAVTGRGVADELVDRAIDTWADAARAPRGSAIVSEDHPALMCGVAYLWTGRLDEARSVFQILERDSRQRGSEVGLGWALFWLVDVELLAGNWRLAAGYVDEALRVVETADAMLSRGTISAHLGLVDDARRDLIQVLADAEACGSIDTLHDVLGRLGFLELSLGNLAEARRYLSRATEIFIEAGICDPGVVHEVHFLPDEIETLVGLGELAEAERHTDWLEERGRELDRPWAIASGARCRGLLFAAKGELNAALAHLERAIGEHDRLPMPFERARTLLVLGTIRRHAMRKRAAREALEEALAIFDRLGARLWAGKARTEMAAIGGRPAATGELTPSEERVARLAAAGRTNREIAEALYLSARTVETHLSRAYHKLEVRSRTELATALDGSATT
jgi:DNA-binding CsgD family transcriptional regulator